MNRLLLKNCDVVSFDERYKADIYIVDDKIQRIDRNVENTEINPDWRIVDMKGMLVFPGFIDTHVHFRQPGNASAEGFKKGSKAALRGGVTTILDMPNNKPFVSTIKRLEKKRALAKKSMYVNYGFYIAATNRNLKQILQINGIAGVKLFYGSTTGDILVDDKHAVEELFKKCKHKIIVHAEDEEIIKANSARFQDNHTPDTHFKVRDKKAAITAIRKIIDLTEKYNANVHIAHLSSPEEVELLKNTNITGEIAIPHLCFNVDDYATLGNLIKCNPSVKCTASEVDKLWEYLREMPEMQVVTDHAPHPLSDKNVEDYWKANSGIPAIENASRMLLKAVVEKKLTLSDITRVYSYNPAQKFNIVKRGQIKEGFYADFAIVNPNKVSKIANENQISRCGWTPFAGLSIPYDIEKTIINGKIVYENEEFNIDAALNSASEVFQ